MGLTDAAAARPGLLIAPLAALILMAAEYGVARLTRSDSYDLGETAASWSSRSAIARPRP